MILYLIKFIHLFLVLFLVLSVFISHIQYKKIALTILIFLLLQYIFNFGKCGLTELERIIKGDKYHEGFLYQIIKPIITIPEDYFNFNFYIIHIIYIILLFYQINLNNI